MLLLMAKVRSSAGSRACCRVPARTEALFRVSTLLTREPRAWMLNINFTGQAGTTLITVVCLRVCLRVEERGTLTHLCETKCSVHAHWCAL